MQSIKPDMDDLMREAAAGYPVVPAGANWLHMAAMLKKDSKKEGHGVLKKLALVIPFFLAGFVCDRYMMPHRLSSGLQLQIQALSKEQAHQNSTSSQRRPLEKSTQKRGSIKSKTPLQLRWEGIVVPNYVANNDAATKLTDQSTNSISMRGEVGLSRPVLSVPHFSLAMPPPSLLKVPRLPPPKATTPLADTKYYVGLFAGPDVSSVRRQGWERAGYSLALAAGMNLGKSWRVETGLNWDRKEYFTSGTYFKTDKIALPPHSKVIEIGGYCNMFEWPVYLAYRVLQKGNTKLWLSAGTSSYFMRNEDYDYVYERYNTSYSGKSEYKKHSKHWFSMASASLAVETKLTSRMNLRVEPYMRVPLRGVGIGSIPVSSRGVLVGFTHPF